MKHVTPPHAVAETKVKAPTRRAIAKQQTRAKVLNAARELFSEQGYEGATIRDIAAAAGMSTGAVFANFADKSELFREILSSDAEALADEMRAAALKGKNVEDGLLKMFMTGYAFYKSQMPLARAAFSVSWSSQDGLGLRSMPSVTAFPDIIVEQLGKAVERGELGRECEVKLRGQMLYDAYLANYPNAIFHGWGLEALQQRTQDQIRILLSGARRG